MDILLNMNVLPDPSTQELWWRVLITCLLTFIVNLPFGYWRGSLRKLSFLWFFSIHAPVPLIVVIRKFENLQLTWSLAPFLVGSFFLGQFIGRKIYSVKPWRKVKTT